MTAASDTLHPGAAGGDKMQVLASLAGQMAIMTETEWTEFSKKVQDMVGKSADGVSNNAAKNAATVAMKGAVKEEIDNLFNGEELSEDFIAKTTTLFEAALEARIAVERTELEQVYEELYSDAIDNIQTDMVEKVDTYLDYAVQNWLTENEVAIESSLKTEVTENFIEGLRELFAANYIEVPEERLDVLEALSEENAELEDTLNIVINENLALKDELVAHSVIESFAEVSQDLTLNQREHFSTLVENLEFGGDVDEYKEKLLTIKEHYITKSPKTKPNNSVLTETFEGEVASSETGDNIPPEMKRYASAISKSVANR